MLSKGGFTLSGYHIIQHYWNTFHQKMSKEDCY